MKDQKKCDCMTHEVKMALIKEMTLAIEAIHRRGFVHNYLRAKNILLTKDQYGKYRVKLCNFKRA